MKYLLYTTFCFLLFTSCKKKEVEPDTVYRYPTFTRNMGTLTANISAQTKAEDKDYTGNVTATTGYNEYSYNALTDLYSFNIQYFTQSKDDTASYMRIDMGGEFVNDSFFVNNISITYKNVEKSTRVLDGLDKYSYFNNRATTNSNGDVIKVTESSFDLATDKLKFKIKLIYSDDDEDYSSLNTLKNITIDLDADLEFQEVVSE